jgi:riboflavin synthase
LGGHLVTGHIDGVGRLVKKTPSGSSTIFTVEVPETLMRFIVEKGSVALDGISLTVNRCQESVFEINIIPHTYELTTLNMKKVGDILNIETDLIGKYVARLLGAQFQPATEEGKKGLDIDLLKDYGFVKT